MEYGSLLSSGRAPSIAMTEVQKEAVATYNMKVSKGEYEFCKTRCLCGSTSPAKSVLEFDRYGMNCNTLICEECGVIRIENVLAEDSLARFYRDDYRSIYVGQAKASADFFKAQLLRGRDFVRLVEREGAYPGANVFEIGCGAGGILGAFRESGYSVAGCDYGESYLEYGRLEGLDLRAGGISESGLSAETQDVIVLSHVFEHFSNPVAELKKILYYLKIGGVLVIEVPGIFDIRRQYHNPRNYFQGAHVYNFCQEHLESLFQSMGLKVLYSDEKCTFLLENCGNESSIKSHITASASRVKKIKQYLKLSDLLWRFRLNPYFYRSWIKANIGI